MKIFFPSFFSPAQDLASPFPSSSSRPGLLASPATPPFPSFPFPSLGPAHLLACCARARPAPLLFTWPAAAWPSPAPLGFSSACPQHHGLARPFSARRSLPSPSLPTGPARQPAPLPSSSPSFFPLPPFLFLLPLMAHARLESHHAGAPTW